MLGITNSLETGRRTEVQLSGYSSIVTTNLIALLTEEFSFRSAGFNTGPIVFF